MLALPTGIGGNVHSQLLTKAQLKPMFNWVRYDMADQRVSPKDAYAWYTKQGVSMVWLIRDETDLANIYKGGIRNACIEVINEPDITFPAGAGSPGRPSMTPDEYIKKAAPIYSKCKWYGYTVIAPCLSHWNVDWLIRFVYLNGMRYVDAFAMHTYGADSVEALVALINSLKYCFPEKKIVFTEYCTYIAGESVATQAKRLTSLVQKSLELGVPFCIYDVPNTDPNVALLTTTEIDGAKTALYLQLEQNLGFTKPTLDSDVVSVV